MIICKGVGILALLALSLISSSVFAQEARGTIQGRVVDTSGFAVPGASVEVRNIATGVVSPMTSNEQGSYPVPFLIPGTYRVTVSLQGFSTFINDGIELHVADVLAVDATPQGRQHRRIGHGHCDCGDRRSLHRRARTGGRRAAHRRAAYSRRQSRRARRPRSGCDRDHRFAVAQGRLQ